MNFITTCTVLLVVFIIHSTCGFDGVFENKFCPGNDIYKLQKSLIDCMAECNKKTMCMGIVHKKKTCWMKSKCDKRLHSLRSSIYLKPTGGFDFKKRYTCPGNDVAIIGEKMSRAKCMIQCNENLRCIAVTYNRGHCWGKSKCNARVKNGNFNTYFRPEGDTVITNMNCPGNDIYKNGMGITLKQCIQFCGDIPMCVAVVYSEDTLCWLKLQCTTRVADKSSTIHLLSSSTEIITNRNCALNDINEKRMELSLPQCIQLCGDVPRCVAIVYSLDKYCWLKSKCAEIFYDNSHIYLLSWKDANRCPS